MPYNQKWENIEVFIDELDVFRIDKHGLNTLLDAPLKILITHGLSAITHQLYSSRPTPQKLKICYWANLLNSYFVFTCDARVIELCSTNWLFAELMHLGIAEDVPNISTKTVCQPRRPLTEAWACALLLRLSFASCGPHRLDDASKIPAPHGIPRNKHNWILVTPIYCCLWQPSKLKKNH